VTFPNSPSAARTTTYYDRVTYTRRFFGDSLLEGLLMGVTLFVGWFIWLAIVAPKGQTPAKQLIGVVILDNVTGKIASTGQVWQREVLGKLVPSIVLSIIGFIALDGQNGSNLSSLYSIAGGISLLADKDDRAIWDRIANTRVAREVTAVVATSAADRLEELERLRESGAITDSEYMSRRREIINGI